MNLKPRRMRRARDQCHLVDRRGAAAGGVLHAVVELRRRGAAAHPSAAGELGADRAAQRRAAGGHGQRRPVPIWSMVASSSIRAPIRCAPPSSRAPAPAARSAPVTIRADGRATHQAVVTAMDVLARLGFTQMNLATVKRSTAEPERPLSERAVSTATRERPARRARSAPRLRAAAALRAAPTGGSTCSACSAPAMFAAADLLTVWFVKTFLQDALALEQHPADVRPGCRWR